jgi:hypothetical protein
MQIKHCLPHSWLKMDQLPYLTSQVQSSTGNLDHPINLDNDLNGEVGELESEVYVDSQVELIEDTNVDDDDVPIEVRKRLSWTATQQQFPNEESAKAHVKSLKTYRWCHASRGSVVYACKLHGVCGHRLRYVFCDSKKQLIIPVVIEEAGIHTEEYAKLEDGISPCHINLVDQQLQSGLKPQQVERNFIVNPPGPSGIPIPTLRQLQSRKQTLTNMAGGYSVQVSAS